MAKGPRSVARRPGSGSNRATRGPWDLEPVSAPRWASGSPPKERPLRPPPLAHVACGSVSVAPPHRVRLRVPTLRFCQDTALPRLPDLCYHVCHFVIPDLRPHESVAKEAAQGRREWGAPLFSPVAGRA